MIRLEYSIIVSAAIFCMAATPIPDGWRTPTEKEINQDWRKEKSHHYVVVNADFNGDGIEDEARLLVRQKGQGMALFAFVSQGKSFKEYSLDELEDAGWLEVMGIDLAKKGKYKTACGKGYFDCESGEPEQINLKRPAIDYFKEGSANSFFYWDDKKKAFNRVWISD
jgi:hypothetical protein